MVQQGPWFLGNVLTGVKAWDKAVGGMAFAGLGFGGWAKGGVESITGLGFGEMSWELGAFESIGWVNVDCSLMETNKHC